MAEITLTFIFAVFIAGMVTFLAPCTLPMVPAFLGFISGASISEGGRISPSSRRRIVINALFYVLGFSMVFITLGVLAGFAGGLLAPLRDWLSRIGGIIVILFGLYLMGMFKLSLSRSREDGKTYAREKGPLASFSFGAAFGAGWSPCVGPIVGTVLLLASTHGTVGSGAFLLGVFSLGLALPFLLAAFFISHATSAIGKIEKYLPRINKVVGALIVALGILLLTGNLNSLVVWGYRLFDFVNYDKILNYL